MQKWIDANVSEPSIVGQQRNETSTAKKGSSVEDTSLTSLNWLPEFKIQSIDGKEDKVLSKSSASSVHSTDSSASSSGSWTQESEIEKDECFVPLSPIKRCRSQTVEFEKDPLRFEENSSKPPFSYTTIIYLAIRSCNKDKVMLSDIYQWIKDHFKYYRIAESTWQNSVRHNLSLNQFFRKIPRGEGDPGKGSFWQINPEYEHLLRDDKELQRLVQQQNGIRTPAQRKRSKTRRKAHSFSESFSNAGPGSSKVPTGNGITLGTKKHCKSDNKQRSLSTTSPPMTGVDPCHLPGDLDWVSLLSSQKYGCSSCMEGQHYKSSFGSPVLTMSVPTELDPIPSTSMPVLPITAVLPNKIPDIPSQKPILTNSLDEIITTQESPAPLLPPWAVESRPFSPTHFNIEHPWAESNRGQEAGIPKLNRHWSSPAGEVMWSNPQINRSNKQHLAQLI